MKPKIFCFNNGGSEDWWTVLAIAEDGTCVGTHVCSHPGFMKGDIGYSAENYHHEEYRKHYPDGYELVWIEGDPREHAGLMEAYRLNQLQPKG